MEITVKNNIKISDCPFEEEIKTRLTVNNPKFEEAQKMGRYTGNIESKLKFYTEIENQLEIPRGFIEQLLSLARRHGIKPEITDHRRSLEPIEFNFQGNLRPLQQPACNKVLKHSFGLLHAPTGSGKTCMALWLIAQRQQSALIVVHTNELLNQWIDSIEQFLQIPRDEIGIIGSGKIKIGKKITVAMIQTLVKKPEQVAPSIGYLILDECHRASAMQYVKAIKAFDCKYMTGLTATPWRRDGLSKIIFWHIGNVTGQIDKADLLKNGNLCQAEVRWIKTQFNTMVNASEFYSKALSELTEDYHRNRLICDTVSNNNGTGISLVLSDRKEHCSTIQNTLLTKNQVQAEVLTGATKKKERKKIIKDLHQGKCRYLIATGQLIGEGFDLPEISSMFLTTPVKFSGRVIQYVGRALRPAPGKEKAIIFDFVDILNPVFEASARARAYTYKQERIFI